MQHNNLLTTSSSEEGIDAFCFPIQSETHPAHILLRLFENRSTIQR